MSTRLKVYLSGPISGHSYGEATGWRETLAGLLIPAGIVCLDPMRGKALLSQKKKLDPQGYKEYPLSQVKAIYMRDMWDVMRCDIVAVYLLEAEGVVSIGTCFEVAWASVLHKPMVGCWVDKGAHDHGFITEAIGARAKDLDEMAEMLIGLGVGAMSNV